MRDRIIRIADVQVLVGVGRSTVYRWEAEGAFPRRRQVGPGVVGWLESEVLEWLASRPVAVADAPAVRA